MWTHNNKSQKTTQTVFLNVRTERAFTRPTPTAARCDRRSPTRVAPATRARTTSLAHCRRDLAAGLCVQTFERPTKTKTSCERKPKTKTKTKKPAYQLNALVEASRAHKRPDATERHDRERVRRLDELQQRTAERPYAHH